MIPGTAHPFKGGLGVPPIHIDDPAEDTPGHLEIPGDPESCTALAAMLAGAAAGLRAENEADPDRTRRAVTALAEATLRLADALALHGDTLRAVRRDQLCTPRPDPVGSALLRHRHATAVGKSRHALRLAAEHVTREIGSPRDAATGGARRPG